MASSPSEATTLRTAIFTAISLVAFAANSVICRLALGRAAIDAMSFTSIRLVSGAVILGLLIWLTKKHDRARSSGSWISAAALFTYALGFSLAYRTLSAGTGALVLFGSVQLTMLLSAVARGERGSPTEWIGLLLAVFGLVWLVWPGLSAPSPLGAGLMTVAGMAWGFYSLRGRRSQDPLGDTAGNFVRTVPLVALLCVIAFRTFQLNGRGAGWAILSGAVSSGLGYVVWYSALRGLSSLRAALVQLAVPVIAAAGGIAFLGELPNFRLSLSGALILGGIAFALVAHRRTMRRP